MNPAKLLEEILSILRRYMPILIVHVLVFIWLDVRVLQVEGVVDGLSLWNSFTRFVDATLATVGLDVERWYVLAALVIGYLTAFQWTVAVVAELPLLRLTYITRFDPHLVADAGVDMRLEPDYWKAREALADLIDDKNNELIESDRIHPYQWVFDQQTLWYRYYGTLLVFFLAAVAWAWEGGTLARSSADVWELVVVLGGVCLATRWKLQRSFLRQRNLLGYWALREFRRNNNASAPDPLQWERRELFLQERAAQKAMSRHPARIIESLLRRLPTRLATPLRQRIDFPYFRPGADWEILSAKVLRHGDEAYTPPQALSTDPFREQFSALLDCTGAGLCVLVPKSLALAPSVPGSGSSYDFALRRHGGHIASITLITGEDPDGQVLAVDRFGDGKAFLALVGDYPIERMAQFDFPVDGRPWHKLMPPFKDEAIWSANCPRGDSKYMEIPLSSQLPVSIGSCYMMGLRSHSGTELTLAFQCFAIAKSDRLLLAWRILDVRKSDTDTTAIPPWWNPRSWKEVRRSVPDRPGRQNRSLYAELREGLTRVLRDFWEGRWH